MYAGGTADGGAAHPPSRWPAGEPVATTELLMIHVDQAAGRAAPFPDDVRRRFAALTGPVPEWAGRSIGPVPKEARPRGT